MWWGSSRRPTRSYASWEPCWRRAMRSGWSPASPSAPALCTNFSRLSKDRREQNHLRPYDTIPEEGAHFSTTSRDSILRSYLSSPGAPAGRGPKLPSRRSPGVLAGVSASGPAREGGRGPGGDVAHRGEPHPRVIPDVAKELFQREDPSRPTRDPRVHREDEAPPLAVDAVEFLGPHPEDAVGVRDPIAGPPHVPVQGRVVQEPLDGDLHEGARRGVDCVRDVIAHERAIVGEPVLREEGGSPDIELPGRRPVAGGSQVEVCAPDLKLVAEDALLLALRRKDVEGLVDVAVRAHFVARIADRADRRGVVDDRVPGNVEGRRQPEPVQQPENPGKARAHAEPPFLHVREPAGCLSGVLEDEGGLGVDIERQGDCTSGAIRPLHGAAPPFVVSGSAVGTLLAAPVAILLSWLGRRGVRRRIRGAAWLEGLSDPEGRGTLGGPRSIWGPRGLRTVGCGAQGRRVGAGLGNLLPPAVGEEIACCPRSGRMSVV